MTESLSGKQKPITKLIPDKICLVCGFLIAIFVPLLFNPFSTQPVEVVKGAFFEVLVVLMLAGLVVDRLTMRDFWHRQAGDLSGIAKVRASFWTERPHFAPALAYLAVCSIATLLSSDPNRSFWGAETRQGMLVITSLVVFFLLIAETVRSVEQAEWLVSGILIGSVPVALYGCIQNFGLDPLIWQTGSPFPVHSTAGYSLYLGAYLAMVVPFSLARLFAGAGDGALKRNSSYLIILTLQVACLVFTFSRGALVALVAGCAVFSAFAIPQKKRRTSAGVILALLALGGLFFLALSYGWKIAPLSKRATILRSDIFTTRQVSNADRLTVWERTLPMIAGSPLIGYGPDTYAAVYAHYYPSTADESAGITTYWDPHNLVLAQMTSTGILGTLAFGWIALTFYRVVYNRTRHSEQGTIRLLTAALLASATAYLVQAQFNPSGLVATVIFWLIMGIGCGLK